MLSGCVEVLREDLGLPVSEIVFVDARPVAGCSWYCGYARAISVAYTFLAPRTFTQTEPRWRTEIPGNFRVNYESQSWLDTLRAHWPPGID